MRLHELILRLMAIEAEHGENILVEVINENHGCFPVEPPEILRPHCGGPPVVLLLPECTVWEDPEWAEEEHARSEEESAQRGDGFKAQGMILMKGLGLLPAVD